MKKPGLAIFISGRGSNMLAILKNIEAGILKGICEVDFVLSNNPDAAGIKLAESKGIKTFVVPTKNKTREEFENEADILVNKFASSFIILAGFNRILSNKFVTKYKNRIINIHPADTKKFQGLDGYKWAFNNKLKETTITVHYVDEGMDTGAVIKQKKIIIDDCATLDEVEKKGIEEENRFYSEVIAELLKNIKTEN